MNVLIVEDEAHTASLLQEIIEQDKDFMAVEKLESVADAVYYLSKYQQNLDLLFFDIQLADGYSFEIFKHVDVFVPVVFCTAYDEYTLKAIKNNGIDYILKPFREEDIHAALARYKKLTSALQTKNTRPFQMEQLPQTRYQQSFLTQLREKTIVRQVKDIALFYIEFETVYLFTFTGEQLPLFKNLEYIESVCAPRQFFRVNRQMLVNKDAVLNIEPYFNRKVVVQLKIKPPEKVIVSRLKVTSFKNWLEH